MNNTCNIGGYRMLETLQQGNMSTVYKAADAHDNEIFAIKVYHSPSEKRDRNLRRYYREISVLTKVDHPNIVRILDYDQMDDYSYLVMPYYPDRSMMQTRPVFGSAQEPRFGINSSCINDTTTSCNPAMIDDILIFTQYILDALLCLKRNHIVHSDLKPSNILIINRRIPVLTDFGLAKLLSYGNNELTHQGYGIGTLRYMAPEQARGDWTITSKADVYSTGAILYEMLTKSLPYQSDSIQSLVENHAKSKVVQPNTLNPAVDRYLNFIVMKMLETNPDQRPDVEEVNGMINFARQQQHLSTENIHTESYLVQEVGIINPSPL